MGANPYLSVFVKIISKFLIFNAFKLHIIRIFLQNRRKFVIFAMSQSSCGVALRKTYLGATCTKRPTFAFQMNDHQNLSKIASCTPVFTKFEPIIGKSTTPQMDKWRPKTMRRTPKSGIFRPSARPFFHQKRGRTAL